MSDPARIRSALAEGLAALDAGAAFRARRGLHRAFAELEEQCRAGGIDARALRLDISRARERLVALDRAEAEAAVASIAARGLRGAALAERLVGLSDHPLTDDAPHLGDEPLDAFLEALLGTDGRYDGGEAPGAEMIHYDPSPASATLALARRGWLDAGEVFVDVGSGTGRVTLLAALLGEARCVGVEIDAPLVAVAEVARARLAADRAEFRVGDARTVALEDGTSFFFFAPFVGSVLDAVLARLARLAASRPIRVGSWGPSTAAIASAPFLVADRAAPYGSFDLATFRSRT